MVPYVKKVGSGLQNKVQSKLVLFPDVMKYKASFIEYTDNVENTGLTLAQKIGQALGMRDDDDSCLGVGGVMGSQPFANRDKWSACSNRDFKDYYRRKNCLECDPSFFTTTPTVALSELITLDTTTTVPTTTTVATTTIPHQSCSDMSSSCADNASYCESDPYFKIICPQTCNQCKLNRQCFVKKYSGEQFNPIVCMPIL